MFSRPIENVYGVLLEEGFTQDYPRGWSGG